MPSHAAPSTSLLSPLFPVSANEPPPLAWEAALLDALAALLVGRAAAAARRCRRALLSGSDRKESARRAAALTLWRGAAALGHPLQLGAVTVFLCYAPGADSVHLAGDFTHWLQGGLNLWPLRSCPMFALAMPAIDRGQYKLIVNHSWRFDEANGLLQPDGFGGYNSVIDPVLRGRVLAHPRFHSRALRNRRSIYLYLPPSYFTDSAATRYPCVYILDAHENLGRANLPSVFDADIAAQVLPPFIAVFVEHLRRRRGDEFTPFFERGRHGGFLKLLSDELVPWVDHHLRTRPHRDRRVIVGQSFGGTAVVSILATLPELFRNGVALSPVVLWSHHHHRHQVLPRRLSGDARWYVACVGNKEERPHARELVARLRQAGANPVFHDTVASHEYEAWVPHVRAGLSHVLGMRGADGTMSLAGA